MKLEEKDMVQESAPCFYGELVWARQDRWYKGRYIVYEFDSKKGHRICRLDTVNGVVLKEDKY